MGRYRSQQIAFRTSRVEEPVAWADRPPAEYNTGRTICCSPLVTGQSYFYMVSDGTYWRPVGGDQVVYNLAAPIDMALNSNNQKVVSIPFPALLMPDGRAMVEVTMGWDKLAGTSDTLLTSVYFGTADTTSDQLAFPQSSLVTTNIVFGVVQKFARISATTTRKLGSTTIATFSGVGTSARVAAVTVGNMGTTTNYLGVYGKMTTGTTEYGQLHALTVRLIG